MALKGFLPQAIVLKMAQGRKRKTKSSPAFPSQSLSNDAKKGKAATPSSPRGPNDSKEGTQSEPTTVLTDVLSGKASTNPSCDWVIEGRGIPGLVPTQCQYSGGCTTFAHHVCTIEWASSNNIEEGGLQ